MINDPRPYELRLCCRCEHSAYDIVRYTTEEKQAGVRFLRCKLPRKSQQMQTGDKETKCKFFCRIDAMGLFDRRDHGRTALCEIRNERRLHEEPLTLSRRVAER